MRDTKKYFALIGGSLLIGALIIFTIFNFGSFGGITGSVIYDGQPSSSEGKDSYIREDFPDSNFKNSKTMDIGKTQQNESLRGIIQFNLSSIGQDRTISSANVTLHLNSSSNNNATTINAYRVSNSWKESDVSWNSRTSSESWSSPGADYQEKVGSFKVSKGIGYYNFSITGAARKWVNGTLENNGMVLISNDSSEGDFKSFDTSDSASSLRPKITVEHFANTAPTVENISTNTSESNPAKLGESINFEVNWSDTENDPSKTFICNSDNITQGNGCQTKSFCNTSLSSEKPINCDYKTQDSDNTTTDFWVSVCDSSKCSPEVKGQFYTNDYPSINLTQPNGGETLNQSDQGDYEIEFNVSDPDSDNLTSNIYYSENKNSKENLIKSLDLGSYCTDPDGDTSTKNQCTYGWNTSGIYGDYYVTITVNDTHLKNNDSSDNSFEIVSLEDNVPPKMDSKKISSNITSGDKVIIKSNVTEENPDSAWATINSSRGRKNITMKNQTSKPKITYRGSWIAEQTGNYQFRVSSIDEVGNKNSTSWEHFNVSKPNASTSIKSPSSSLPYHTIRVEGGLSTEDSLKGANAYLNVPEGFSFLEDYPQSNSLGNVSSNESKNITWFLSSPFEEGNYEMNVTYSDKYSNSWQSKENEIEVASSTEGYSLSISGYPEASTGNQYYLESNFEKDSLVDADSMEISLYDASGNKVVDSVSMKKMSQGEYNYSYSVPSSATEGKWESVVNATVSNTSYYRNEFWDVIGGPFDVRDIVIEDNELNELNVSVDTENTGGTNKDLTLEWNLTRQDNRTLLDTGAETFMVPANSVKEWYVQPSTSYEGNVKITLIGYYGPEFTRKAGAYKTFSTVQTGGSPGSGAGGSGGSGGGGGAGAISPPKELSKDFKISLPRRINLTKNLERNVEITINNTGKKEIKDVSISINGLEKSNYNISKGKTSIKPGKTSVFETEFSINEFLGKKNITIKAESSELERSKKLTLSVLRTKEYLRGQLKNLRDKASEIRDMIANLGKQKLINDLDKCVKKLDRLEENINKEEIINSNKNLKESRECIKSVENEYSSLSEKENESTEKEPSETGEIGFDEMEQLSMTTIITWTLILILIILIGIGIYLIYKKLNLFNFYKNQKGKISKKKPRKPKDEYLDEKIDEIEEKLEE